ncbi:uncharacterized protein WCC33_011324 [Rhinophrynus dorsalis]
MKIEVLSVLLFIAVASAFRHDAAQNTNDDQQGMCPHEYFKKHPELKKKMKEQFMKEHDREDRNGQRERGSSEKHHRHHDKPPMRFPNFTRMADCVADGDCKNNMRCCRTPCGMKCMRPIFTEDDFHRALEDNEDKNRPKRDAVEGTPSQQGEELGRGHGEGAEHGKGHGKGLEHGKGAEHGKGHGKGLEHGKGAEHGKGHGKGLEHGKGAEHGKGHGKGLEHGKGAEHGKGHGKGLEHGKGAKNGKGHGKGLEHGKGAEHGKGHGKGLEHGKGPENGGQQGVQEGSGEARQ